MKFLLAAIRYNSQKQIIMDQRYNHHTNQSCFVFELNKPHESIVLSVAASVTIYGAL